jgi:hypothetical protein
MGKLNYSLLKGRLILCVSVLIVCFLLLFLSFLQVSKKEQLLHSTQLDVSNTKQEVVQLNNLVSLFENFSTGYKQYVNKGFLQEEKRLAWIETLESTANRLGLNDLHYQIEARKTPPNNNLTPSPGITLFVSTLKLESGLVHEGDLIDLIGELAKLDSGLFVVDSCRIERTTTNPNQASNHNFQASCSALWYTATYDEQSGSFMEDDI